jgi:hypothetical protein
MLLCQCLHGKRQIGFNRRNILYKNRIPLAYPTFLWTFPLYYFYRSPSLCTYVPVSVDHLTLSGSCYGNNWGNRKVHTWSQSTARNQHNFHCPQTVYLYRSEIHLQAGSNMALYCYQILTIQSEGLINLEKKHEEFSPMSFASDQFKTPSSLKTGCPAGASLDPPWKILNGRPFSQARIYFLLTDFN